MNKIFILYWEPGSCGDFVHSLFLKRPEEYYGVIDNFSVDDRGRVVPSGVLPFFKDNFSHEGNAWYLRTWNDDDIVLLLTFLNGNRTFVLPTIRYDQLEFLQSRLENATTVGMTYPSNMFPLVLKNWCKKVASIDPKLRKHYTKPLHQYLINKNVFGEYILKEQLNFGSKIKQSVNECFDINIPLENLYNRNLSDLKKLFHDSAHIDTMFNEWIKKQSVMHQYYYNVPIVLKQALGFNSVATQHGNPDAELDIFDNILINHQIKSTVNFKTLKQAANFLETGQH
jgi:hypothetical protein